jgi:nucleotide-binding universal stress UspA family protein
MPLHASVVFATDFTSASQNAGLYASALSTRLGTNLVVAHGFALTQAALEVEMEKPLHSRQRANLQCDLAAVAKTLEPGLGTAEPVLLDGDPRRVIPAFAKTKNDSLIVLGAHSRGSVDRHFFGSTAEEIIHRARGLALTVGPNVKILPARTLDIRRILHATDCSLGTAHGALAAVAWADRFKAELDVLNVIQSSQVSHPEQLHMLEEHFYAAVDSMTPPGAGQVRAFRTFVRVGRLVNELLSHIDERQIDLLVLGLRHSHDGMLNHCSGAFSIIIEAQCPVLTVAAGSNASVMPGGVPSS